MSIDIFGFIYITYINAKLKSCIKEKRGLRSRTIKKRKYLKLWRSRCLIWELTIKKLNQVLALAEQECALILHKLIRGTIFIRHCGCRTEDWRGYKYVCVCTSVMHVKYFSLLKCFVTFWKAALKVHLILDFMKWRRIDRILKSNISK